MKKIIFLIAFVFLLFKPAGLFGHVMEEQGPCFSTAFTAGYVFKRDSAFKQIYGRGVINIITVDGCYYIYSPWGIGAKVSYWRAKGHTEFLKQRSFLQEFPITFYLRRIKDFSCGLQIYGSLGGGVMLIKEKSYLGDAKLHKGIGELEFGLNYPIWNCINFSTAFRYVFPRALDCKSSCDPKLDIGGLDLRAGLELRF